VAQAPQRALDPDASVAWLAAALGRGRWRRVLAGVADDDCAVVRLGREIAVISVDFLNATPIAEQLSIGGERVLGRLAVAATLADLYGSGARPVAMLVAVTAPHGYPERLFKEIMRGAHKESKRWNVPIVGGDTKLGRARAILTCGLGVARSTKNLFLGNRAKPGDAILASGCLGTCAAAAYFASRRGVGRALPQWVRDAITKPSLPARRSRALASLGIANGGTDISDGLAADLRALCSASAVGAVLDAEAIPVHPRVLSVARSAGVPAWAFSLASGGDFQFIVTVPERLCRRAERLGFVRIGMIIKQRALFMKHSATGPRRRLPRVGHRDRRGQRFAAEIRRIVSEVTREQR